VTICSTQCALRAGIPQVACLLVADMVVSAQSEKEVDSGWLMWQYHPESGHQSSAPPMCIAIH